MKPKDRTAGYSAESLRMLETEEGQGNAVFACFGSAAQHAQLFEQALGRFLSVYNRAANSAFSISDFEAYEGKLQKMTMGTLLREMEKYVSFDDSAVEDRLDGALDRRNHLMHAFFLERGGALKSEDGRLNLLRELTSTEAVLDSARITVNAMRIAMCEALNVPDPFAADYAEDAG
jgi:hypothetical protein